MKRGVGASVAIALLVLLALLFSNLRLPTTTFGAEAATPARVPSAIPGSTNAPGAAHAEFERVSPPAREASGTSGAGMRQLLVLDPSGAGVPDARIFAGGTPCASRDDVRARQVLARTDSRGLVQLDLTWLPYGATVCAPGARIVNTRPPAGDEPWIVTLPRAHRLEIVLIGAQDLRGLHVELALSSSFTTRRFFQSKYEQTPGRAVDGTPAHWSGSRERSNWSLGFTDEGRATLDQLEDSGTACVALWRFGEELERRELALSAEGGTWRLDFSVPQPPPELRGRVTDASGRALADARVRMIVARGRVIVDSSSIMRAEEPCWAPRAMADSAGCFALPRPSDPSERVLFQADGRADRVLTIAELDAASGVVRLARGFCVRLELIDRDGQALDGGWSTSGRWYAEPSVHVGHDVWRGPAPDGREPDCELPCFLFERLPGAEVVFACDELPADELLRHDARLNQARFVASCAVDELKLGE